VADHSNEIDEVLFGVSADPAETPDFNPPIEAQMVVVKGRASQEEIQLKLPAVIGRGADSTVLVKHPTVSRAHCEITQANGVLRVRDLGSKNGTFVGGKQVAEAELRPGETLGVGPLTFRIVYQRPLRRPAPPAPLPAPPPAASPPAPLSEDQIDFLLSDSSVD
jgi:predicted component of type VI protein secretion system